jgi:hypothetical protein
MSCPNLKCDSEKCDKANCERTAAAPLESGVAVSSPAAEVVANPIAAIRDHAGKFDALYAAYDALRNLAKPLNGMQQSDPLPANLKIQSIKISYELDGAQYAAEISTVNFVGELAPLLGPALKNLIAEIRAELNALDSVTTAVKAAVGAVTVTSQSAQISAAD